MGLFEGKKTGLRGPIIGQSRRFHNAVHYNCVGKGWRNFGRGGEDLG